MEKLSWAGPQIIWQLIPSQPLHTPAYKKNHVHFLWKIWGQNLKDLFLSYSGFLLNLSPRFQQSPSMILSPTFSAFLFNWPYFFSWWKITDSRVLHQMMAITVIAWLITVKSVVQETKDKMKSFYARISTLFLIWIKISSFSSSLKTSPNLKNGSKNFRVKVLISKRILPKKSCTY